MNEEPIRVAHIVGKMVGGGVEAFIMNYYRNIDRTKVQFDFIIDSDSTVVPKDEIEKMGGRIFIVPPYQKVFSYIKEIRNILKENKYKIVHSHLNSLSVFPLLGAYLAKVPVRIAHSHSTTNKKEWKKNIIKNLLRPFSKVFATNFFACSEHAAKWLFGNKAFDKKNVKIITNAIDTVYYTYDEEKRKCIRRELNIEDKIVFGHVGRFVQQKNHEFLINFFVEILQKNDNSMLILIGDGPLEEKIKKIVKENGIEEKVIFLGVRNNVNEIMQALDYFVFPSLYEGLGIAVIEAQCSNLPIIISDNVPEEVYITSNVVRVSLSIGEKKWAEILMTKKFEIRKKMHDKVIEYGFDIRTEKNKLQKLYVELNNNI